MLIHHSSLMLSTMLRGTLHHPSALGTVTITTLSRRPQKLIRLNLVHGSETRIPSIQRDNSSLQSTSTRSSHGEGAAVIPYPSLSSVSSAGKAIAIEEAEAAVSDWSIFRRFIIRLPTVSSLPRLRTRQALWRTYQGAACRSRACVQFPPTDRGFGFLRARVSCCRLAGSMR